MALTYQTTCNEQGRMVLPQVIRELFGIEKGGYVEMEWDVDYHDHPILVIRPYYTACAICGSTTNLKQVPKTRQMICGSCATHLLSEDAKRQDAKRDRIRDPF